MLLTFYILLGFYFTVVITHALTRANVPPEMIVGPCTIKFIDRIRADAVVWKDEYVIDRMMQRYEPKDFVSERIVHCSLERLIHSIPKELLEFTQEENWRTGNLHCTTRIIIVDPRFKK